MTEMMEKTWSLYEAEKATGNAEAANLIGDVYTVLDMIDTDTDMEEKEDWAYSTYLNIGRLAMGRYGLVNMQKGPLWEIRNGLEDAMTKAGLLEADEEPEEADEYDSETNYDEWVADQRYDAYRDNELAMAYER